MPPSKSYTTNMRQIIFLFVGLFLSLTIVSAAETEKFSFYKNINDQLIQHEKTWYQDLEKNTGISKNTIQNILENNISARDEAEMQKWCGSQEFFTSCQERLFQYFSFETHLQEWNKEISMYTNLQENPNTYLPSTLHFSLIDDTKKIANILGTPLDIPQRKHTNTIVRAEQHNILKENRNIKTISIESQKTIQPIASINTCENSIFSGYYCQKIQKECFENQSCEAEKTTFRDNILFGSYTFNESLLGFLQSTNKIYNGMLSSTPLTPQKAQNQAGFLTQPWTLMRSNDEILSFRKTPPSLIRSPLEIDFSAIMLQKEFNTVMEIIKNTIELSPEKRTVIEIAPLAEKIKQRHAVFQFLFSQDFIRKNDHIRQNLFFQNTFQTTKILQSTLKNSIQINTLALPHNDIEDVRGRMCESV